MGRKVIHTILNLRDNMSGGMVKAAKKVKGVNKEMLAATRTVERFQRKTADACSRAVGSLGKLGVVLKRAQYFITCSGKMTPALRVTPAGVLRALTLLEAPALPAPYEQLSLFPA